MELRPHLSRADHDGSPDELRRIVARQRLRDIARRTRLDRTTVRRYGDAAKSAALFAETPHDDALVHAIIASAGVRVATAERAARTASAPRARIEAWLEERLLLKLSKVRGVSASYATLRCFAIGELGWGRR